MSEECNGTENERQLGWAGSTVPESLESFESEHFFMWGLSVGTVPIKKIRFTFFPPFIFHQSMEIPNNLLKLIGLFIVGIVVGLAVMHLYKPSSNQPYYPPQYRYPPQGYYPQHPQQQRKPQSVLPTEFMRFDVDRLMQQTQGAGRGEMPMNPKPQYPYPDQQQPPQQPYPPQYPPQQMPPQQYPQMPGPMGAPGQDPRFEPHMAGKVDLSGVQGNISELFFQDIPRDPNNGQQQQPMGNPSGGFGGGMQLPNYSC